MNDLCQKLRQSWDTDRSIISQTNDWMEQRRDAADEIERLVVLCEAQKALIKMYQDHVSQKKACDDA